MSKKRVRSPNDDDFGRIAEQLHKDSLVNGKSEINSRKTFNSYYKEYMSDTSNKDMKRVHMRENVYQEYARKYPGSVDKNETIKGYDRKGNEREAKLEKVNYKKGPSYRLRDIISGIFLSQDKKRR